MDSIKVFMSDLFPYCLAFTLKNEGGFYQNPVTGECANFGISLKWYQAIKTEAVCDDIKALTVDRAMNLYKAYFWDTANLAVITLPTVAARVFDTEVNMGQSQGIRLLQACLDVETDGILGPVTASRCNAMDESWLYEAFIAKATTRYHMIHDEEVVKYGQELADKNLKVWLDRLATNPPPFQG